MSIGSIIAAGLTKAFGSQFKSQHNILATAISDAILPELNNLKARLSVVEAASGVSSAPIPKTPAAPGVDTNPSTPPDTSIP